jgi:hypothetical protein
MHRLSKISLAWATRPCGIAVALYQLCTALAFAREAYESRWLPSFGPFCNSWAPKFAAGKTPAFSGAGECLCLGIVAIRGLRDGLFVRHKDEMVAIHSVRLLAEYVGNIKLF